MLPCDMTPTARSASKHQAMQRRSKQQGSPPSKKHHSGSCVTTCMGITIQILVKATEQILEANCGHIKLDGILFLDLTLLDAPCFYSPAGKDGSSGRIHRHR